MDYLFQWVSSYGYAAIFGFLVLGIVGLPVPDETLLVFSGYLIWRGNLKAIPVLLVAFLGSISGITLSYVIGRTLGLGFIHKWGRYVHVTESRLDVVAGWVTGLCSSDITSPECGTSRRLSPARRLSNTGRLRPMPTRGRRCGCARFWGLATISATAGRR